MPSLVDVVHGVSQDCSAAFAYARMAPLTAGQILIGAKHLSDAGAPPRVVVVFTDDEPRPTSRGTAMVEAEDEHKKKWLLRVLQNMRQFMRVRVVGPVNQSEPERNFDSTRLYADQVKRSILQAGPGYTGIGRGRWITDHALDKAGEEYEFDAWFETPLTDALANDRPRLEYAPDDAEIEPTLAYGESLETEP